MAKPHLFCGLDIGTQKTKILLVGINKEKEPEVIYQAQEDSDGIRKGVIVNPEGTSNVLEEVLKRTKEETGQRIDSVFVNVDGSHLFANLSRGLVSVSRADQKISGEDIQRVLQTAQDVSLPSNKEIFNVLPKEFIVDGEKGIREAQGLQGVRLEAEVLVLGGFAPYLRNLTKAVLDSELQILDMIPSPVAAGRAVLTSRQKELGVAVLDIGAGTSGLAVFEEGDLVHLIILPMGSANITNDIAIGLKTDLDIAEKIKIEYGSCLAQKSQRPERIDTGEEEPLVFSQKQLARIIEARVSEISGEVNKELKKISREKLLPAGLVLTGGGAKLPKITELVKKELKLPCRIGKPQGILNLEGDPSLATVAGLVLSGTDGGEKEKTFEFGFGRGISSKIKRIFKIFIP